MISNRNNIVGITSINYVNNIKHVREVGIYEIHDTIFDNMGNCITHKCHSIDGELTYCRESIYNDKKLKIRDNIYGKDMILEGYIDYIYNGCRLIELHECNKLLNTQTWDKYEYDDNGILLNVFKYDSKGNPTSYVEYEYSGGTIRRRLINIREDGSKNLSCESIQSTLCDTYEMKCCLDIYKCGDLLKETHTEYVNDTLRKVKVIQDGVETLVQKYNNNGDIVSLESFSDDGSETVELYEYDNMYNDDGVLILQIKMNLGGPAKCISPKTLLTIFKGEF